jgi:hypothetical protein
MKLRDRIKGVYCRNTRVLIIYSSRTEIFFLKGDYPGELSLNRRPVVEIDGAYTENGAER